MKTERYILEIADFPRFYEYLRKQYVGILGAEYDKETQKLKIFYEDTATPLSVETLTELKIPLILRFRKKIIAPELNVPDAIVTPIDDNEFTVETLNVDDVRQKVKHLFPDYEEIKNIRIKEL